MEGEKKARLGRRWSCYSCSARFYDLNKPDPVCPKCGADQRQSPALAERKRPRKRASRKKAAASRPPASLLEEDGDSSFSQDQGLNGSDEVAELELGGDSEMMELEVEED